MILAGDIGGTKTHLAVFDECDGQPTVLAEETFVSSEQSGLSQMAAEFLARHSLKVRNACFGIAGPVVNGVCRTSNLPWQVDATTLAVELNIARVTLLNDLEATAYGLSAVPQGEIETLHKVEDATPTDKTKAVIAAGTGLGEVGVSVFNGEPIPIVSEGGHCDFAPQNAREIELLRFLQKKHVHVSWERVLSGPGLVNIYDFLCEREPSRAVVSVQRDVAHRGAEVISDAAMSQLCPVCDEALELFISFYGSEAGNLALKFLALGGVYVAGGIAGRIVSRMHRTFRKAFVSKGRMQPVLENIPIWVITTNRTALLGAAAYARRRLT